VEVASVEVATVEAGSGVGTIEGEVVRTGSGRTTLTVRVDVAVRPDWSVAT
jgi:hypothetical protein